jgi:RNase P subunit RPR2
MSSLFCLKCKKHKEVESPETVVTKKGIPAIKAVCPDCGTKMFKFQKKTV